MKETPNPPANEPTAQDQSDDQVSDQDNGNESPQTPQQKAASTRKRNAVANKPK